MLASDGWHKLYIQNPWPSEWLLRMLCYVGGCALNLDCLGGLNYMKALERMLDFVSIIVPGL